MRALVRPALLALLLLAAAPAPTPANPPFEVKGSDLTTRPNSRIEGDTIEAWFEGKRLGAIGQVIPLPGHRTDAYLTVVLKLGHDWTAPGGKLPGLSNTGNLPGGPTLCTVDGIARRPSGWGGRPPDGCHWSARTGFHQAGGHRVIAATYAYAISPANPRHAYGWADGFSRSYPKGRWFAYVEHVKLNTPGKHDGELAYWLVDAEIARGGRRVEHAGHVVWRTVDGPDSAINELWADVFCGGTSCGPEPWPRSTIWLKRLTVTDALPDLGAVEAEVDALNAGGAVAE